MTKLTKTLLTALTVGIVAYGTYNLINNALDKHLMISLKETFIHSYNGYVIQCKENIEPNTYQCNEWANRLEELAEEVKYLESQLNKE